MYDISAKITNKLPEVKITDDIIVTVNNRKSTILNIYAMFEENKRKDDEEHNDLDEVGLMHKALGMLIGQKRADEIEALDLPIPEYKVLYQDLFTIARGDEEPTP